MGGGPLLPRASPAGLRREGRNEHQGSLPLASAGLSRDGHETRGVRRGPCVLAPPGDHSCRIQTKGSLKTGVQPPRTWPLPVWGHLQWDKWGGVDSCLGGAGRWVRLGGPLLGGGGQDGLVVVVLLLLLV